MTAPGAPTCAPAWLALREPADHAARDRVLADHLADHLAHHSARQPHRDRGASPSDALLVRDLGCGTGSMGRWLAPRLARVGGQRWVLHDRDPDLLALAAAAMPAEVTTETVVGDLTTLRGPDLAGADVVVGSALLDLLTAAEVDALARACAAARAAVLVSLSVTGEVTIDPPDPLDAAVAEAFDAHQRREQDGRRLLGPDAPREAAAAFVRHGFRVERAPTPWRLGADRADGSDGSDGADRALAEEWLRGRCDAAADAVPALAHDAEAWLARRLAAVSDPPWRVTVGHVDLLALPGTGR